MRDWYQRNKDKGQANARRYRERHGCPDSARRARALRTRERNAAYKELGIQRRRPPTETLANERATARGRWSSIEDQYLVATYEGLTAGEQALALGRSTSAVKNRLTKLRREGAVGRKQCDPILSAA